MRSVTWRARGAHRRKAHSEPRRVAPCFSSGALTGVTWCQTLASSIGMHVIAGETSDKLKSRGRHRGIAACRLKIVVYGTLGLCKVAAGQLQLGDAGARFFLSAAAGIAAQCRDLVYCPDLQRARGATPGRSTAALCAALSAR